MGHLLIVHVTSFTHYEALETDSRLLMRYPGKARVAVSLSATIEQIASSSHVPVSHVFVRQIITAVTNSVPWFCQIIKLNKEGCLSSLGTEDKETQNELFQSKAIHRGKENWGGMGKQVEGLLIFAKRNGKLIGREDVLKEFREKWSEWENAT